MKKLIAILFVSIFAFFSCNKETQPFEDILVTCPVDNGATSIYNYIDITEHALVYKDLNFDIYSYYGEEKAETQVFVLYKDEEGNYSFENESDISNKLKLIEFQEGSYFSEKFSINLNEFLLKGIGNSKKELMFIVKQVSKNDIKKRVEIRVKFD